MVGLIEAAASFNSLIDTFKLVPFVISAHDEEQDWESLRETIRLLDGDATGIGIPTGGGLVYYPDQSIEPIRHPLYEFSMRDGAINSRLLIPHYEP
jgi:cyanophycinase